MSEARTVFMGTPPFAVPTLRALMEAGRDVRLVVARPDRPAGRGGRTRAPAVKAEAERLGLPVFQPESFTGPGAVATLAAVEPDLIVVAAYGRLLPRAVLALPRRGILNVHPSLLPRWRGPSPVAAAIRAGDERTGVSLIELTARMDAGPVVAARAFPIGPADTAGALEARLAEAGAELLVESLPGWLAGETVAAPQDEASATVCSLLTKEDGRLRAAMTATEAERTVRACDPWPGAFASWAGARLAVWRAHVEPAGDGAPAPGTFTRAGKTPAIAFRKGLLALDEVQREGGRRVSGEAFLNGERGRLPDAAGLA